MNGLIKYYVCLITNVKFHNLYMYIHYITIHIYTKNINFLCFYDIPGSTHELSNQYHHQVHKGVKYHHHHHHHPHNKLINFFGIFAHNLLWIYAQKLA